ncbi:hypothetical protein K2173_011266 [Erythroxylum novogranatense]|uniref:Secreted protein n=1 Tax=Erythroxylum novogranatense TaxID=1862640 RepID=A0AAV8S938_9ROSI|nr:hypothetical protein K2173_011266 [Erythroxylum novogranatense]
MRQRLKYQRHCFLLSLSSSFVRVELVLATHFCIWWEWKVSDVTGTKHNPHHRVVETDRGRVLKGLGQWSAEKDWFGDKLHLHNLFGLS